MLMPKSYLVSLVTLIILTISSVISDRNQCKKGYPFEKLILALQWPPGVCFKNLHKTCLVNIDQFLIHGFWPTNTSSNTSPEFCCNERFSPDDIRHLEGQLMVKPFKLYSFTVSVEWKADTYQTKEDKGFLYNFNLTDPDFLPLDSCCFIFIFDLNFGINI